MNYDIYIRKIPMPSKVHECVVNSPEGWGYDVYINDSLDQSTAVTAYYHALSHISEEDFSKENIQEIEEEAHEGKQT